MCVCSVYFHFVCVSISTLTFVSISWLCARVCLLQAVNSLPVKIVSAVVSGSVSVNQNGTLGPVLSDNYFSLMHPPCYYPSETRAQNLNTSFLHIYLLSCQYWSYSTYVKYSVNLHPLNHLAVVLLLRRIINLNIRCQFQYDVCYSFINSFWRTCHFFCCLFWNNMGLAMAAYRTQ